MNRVFGMLVGMGFGLLVPLLIIMGRAMASRWPWWNQWLQKEFSTYLPLYLIGTMVVVGLVGLLGFLWGQRWEELEEETTEMGDLHSELSLMAATDPLTGLLNKRSLSDRLLIEIANAQRSALSCLMIDIDHFKRINDTYGHPFGDQVLIRVADLIRFCVRRVDAVARLGGEEFMVLLPTLTPTEASQVAERIRVSVEQEEFWDGDHRVQVTVSLGVYTKGSRHKATPEDFFTSADSALYRAKKTGRNRCVEFEVT